MPSSATATARASAWRGRNLTVVDSSFSNSEHGILAGGKTDPKSTLTVLNSSFSNFHSPSGRALTHAIYVGKSIGGLVVENSTFEKVGKGHYIKSRAESTIVRRNVIDDRNGRGAYLVEAPEGGQLVVEDNDLIKGPNAENPAAIAHGHEVYKGGGYVNPPGFVFIGDNRFTNYADRTVYFFSNRTDTNAELHENEITVAAGRVELARGPHFTTTDPDAPQPIDMMPTGSLPPFTPYGTGRVEMMANRAALSIGPAAVPAPATAGLLGTGVFLLLLGRLRFGAAAAEKIG